jgi:hypothetical protein
MRVITVPIVVLFVLHLAPAFATGQDRDASTTPSSGTTEAKHGYAPKIPED